MLPMAWAQMSSGEPLVSKIHDVTNTIGRYNVYRKFIHPSSQLCFGFACKPPIQTRIYQRGSMHALTLVIDGSYRASTSPRGDQ